MPRMENIYKEVLLRKNVPVKDIHFLCDDCLSTIDEAEAARRIFHNNNCKVLVVTSPFHVKRTQMIFQDRMEQCEIRVLATPYEPFPKKWWTDQDSARNVVLELSRLFSINLADDLNILPIDRLTYNLHFNTENMVRNNYDN